MEQENAQFYGYIKSINSFQGVHEVSNENIMVPQESKGFIRCKVSNKPVIIRAIVDCGNLYDTLISEELCKTLRLKITGKSQDVGTAAKNSTIKILGRAEPLVIFIEGINKKFSIRPSVVRGLSHTLNLGLHFLREYKCQMTFNPTGVQLQVGGDHISLIGGKSPLDKPSLDKRFHPLLTEFKTQGFAQPSKATGSEDILDLRPVNSIPNLPKEEVVGVKYGEDKNLLQFEKQKFACIANNNFCVPPQCDMIVSGDPRSQNFRDSNCNVLLHPGDNKDTSLLTKNDVLVHPGVYIMGEQSVQIKVSNYSDRSFVIPQGTQLGFMSKVESQIPANLFIGSLDHKPIADLSTQELQERRDYLIEKLRINENTLLNKDPKLKEKFIALFLKYFDAISISDSDYGETNLMEYKIKLKDPNCDPVNMKCRPLNPAQEKDLKRQLADWEKAGVITATESPWASALVPILKKIDSDGTHIYRWAVDYRKVNELTIKDRYPLPNIEANLHKLAKAKVYSALDSSGAFHCMRMDKESEEYTTFISPLGQYCFTRLPFGLCNAPSQYSRLIDKALQHLPGDFALSYIDDIIVHSKTLQEHLDHLEKVLEAHQRYGMKLNVKKCDICQTQVEYLGHLIGPNGISMVPSYVQKILEYKLPETGKQMASFLGITGYYRTFFPHYAKMTNELNALKQENTIKWTPELIAKFEALKEMFKEGPVRAYPDYQSQNPFILYTDFSAENMAAVLCQVQEGKERFIGCVCHKTNKAQSNYGSTKGELASLILGLKRFEHILRYKKFIVRSDNIALKEISRIKQVQGVFHRWLSYVQSFDFEFEFISGKKNVLADALSRVPGVPEPPEYEKYDVLHQDVVDIYALLDNIPEHNVLSMVNSTQKLRFTNDIAYGQKQDIVIQKIIDLKKSGQKPDIAVYKSMGSELLDFLNVYNMLHVDENDLLYYQAPSRNLKRMPKRVVVPKGYIKHELFNLCHNHALSGHKGITETLHKLKENYWWPHMDTFVSIKINNCVPCFQKENKADSTHSHIMYRERTSFFGQKVSTDLVGPLKSIVYQGKRVEYVLTIQDHFTRYLVGIPVTSTDAKSCITGLMDAWVLRFGIPEQIHSDRGSAFISELYKGMMEKLGINKTYTPPYTPQANRVERSHACLKQVLRADDQLAPGQTNWADRLKYAVFAYNICTNRITGVSPFYAVYGRAATLPCDLIFPSPIKEDFHPLEWKYYIENVRDKFSKIAQEMARHEKNSIELEQQKYASKLRKEPFEKNMLVAFFLVNLKKGENQKLGKRWIGPFQIVQKYSPSLFKIYPHGNWCIKKKEIVTTANKLKKWPSNCPLEISPDNIEDLSAIDSNDEENTLDIIEMHSQIPGNDSKFQPFSSDVPTYHTNTSNVPTSSTNVSPEENSGSAEKGETSKVMINEEHTVDQDLSMNKQEQQIYDESIILPPEHDLLGDTTQFGKPSDNSTPSKRMAGRPKYAQTRVKWSDVDPQLIVEGSRTRTLSDVRKDVASKLHKS